jgi:hypothetical protein
MEAVPALRAGKPVGHSSCERAKKYSNSQAESMNFKKILIFSLRRLRTAFWD